MILKTSYKYTVTIYCFVLLSTLNMQSQSTISSISMRNVSLHQVLMEVKTRWDKKIVYNNNLIEKYTNETVELKDVSLDKVLQTILQGKNLRYKVINDVIIIEPLDEMPQSETATKITQTIRGTVYDMATNSPLIGATVIITLPGKTLGVATDENGNFKISGIPVGRQTLIISYIGYKKKQIDNLMVLSAKENIIQVGLEELVSNLDEVKITAYSKSEPLNEVATVSARAFSIEETEKYAGSWGDPSRMATNFAGVFTAGDQRNDIIIRGNSPTGLLWQVEDIPIPSPNHFDVIGTTGSPISMLNNNLLSRSDFFTSAFPAEYGNATSGVFDLKMRNGNADKREYLAQAGFNGFEAGAEGPISREKKSSYIINMRYSMLGLIQDLLWVDGLPEYKDVSFKLNFPLNSGKLSVFGIGGDSHISQEEDDDDHSNAENEYRLRSENGSKTGIIGLNYQHFFNSKVNIKAAVAWSTRRPYEIVDSVLNDNIYLNLDNNTYKQDEYTVKLKSTYKVNAQNIVNAGVMVQNMSFNANRMTSDDDHNIVTIDKPYTMTGNNINLYQAFAQWKHSLSDKLSVTAGIDALYFQFNQTQALDPRMGLSWQISDKQTIGLGYGLHSQIQPLNVYFIQSKTGIDANGRQVYENLMSNKNLGFTKSHQLVLSYDYLFNPNLRLKTEAYYQYLFDVPVKESKGYFSMINIGAAMSVPEEDSLINAGIGKNYGLELTLEKFLSNNYYFLITTSLFNSLYQGTDKVWRNTTYNGNFVLNALGGYEYEIKENVMLNTNLRVTYAGGRRIIPFDMEQSKQENQTVYIYDKAYEKQVKNYFRTDLRIGVILQRKRATHELAIDIVNVTNHKNVYREKYNSDTQKTKTYYQQGIFPMGLYRINF